jgi:hypothetical protein
MSFFRRFKFKFEAQADTFITPVAIGWQYTNLDRLFKSDYKVSRNLRLQVAILCFGLSVLIKYRNRPVNKKK